MTQPPSRPPAGSILPVLPCGQFPTTVVQRRAVGSLLLSETAYAPRQTLPRHAHERACLIVVLQGAFTELAARHTRVGQPATVIFRPADEPHTNHFHQLPSRCLNIELAPDWLERFHARVALPAHSIDVDCAALVGHTVRLYQEFQAPDAAAPLAIEGLLLEIVATIARTELRPTPRGQADRLDQARTYLQAHFHESPTLATIAEQVGLHPVHLARAFRHRYQLTIGAYTRQLRVAAACRALVDTATPLAEIAVAAGFFDQSHFTRTFKRVTGLTPAAYRAAGRRR